MNAYNSEYRRCYDDTSGGDGAVEVVLFIFSFTGNDTTVKLFALWIGASNNRLIESCSIKKSISVQSAS